MRSILIWLTTATLIACANGAAPGAVPRDAGRDAPVATVFAPPIDADAAPSAQVDAGHHKFGSSQPGHIHRETNFVDDDSGVTTVVSDNATTGAADVTVHLVSAGGVSSVTGASGVSCSPTTGAVSCSNTGVTSIGGLGNISTSASTGPVDVQLTGGVAHAVAVWNGTSAFDNVGASCSSGQALACVPGSDPSFQNTVLSVAGASGVSCSTSAGAATCSNTGVTSLTAGTDITLSGSTGGVTVSVTNPPALGFNATGATLGGSATGTFVSVIGTSMTVPTSANVAVKASISCTDSVGADTYEWGVGVDGSIVPYASQRGYCTNGGPNSYCSGSIDMAVSGLSAASHTFDLIQAIVGAVLPVTGAGCYGTILVTAN